MKQIRKQLAALLLAVALAAACAAPAFAAATAASIELTRKGSITVTLRDSESGSAVSGGKPVSGGLHQPPKWKFKLRLYKWF